MNIKWKKGLHPTTDKTEATYAMIRCQGILPDVFEGASCLRSISFLDSNMVTDISSLLKYPISQLNMSKGCRATRTLVQMVKLEHMLIDTLDPRTLFHLTSLKTLYINAPCSAEILYCLPETLKKLTLRRGFENEIDISRVPNTNVTTLTIHNVNTSLEFVTEFKHLTWLEIRKVDIRALDPVLNLQRLTRLTIKDIINHTAQPLELDLPNLLQLRLRNCVLPNLNFLDSVPAVRQLTLNECVVVSESFDSIYSMKHLSHLNLEGTNISSLKGIERLKDTLAHLILSGCDGVQDITPLSFFRKLRTLELVRTCVYDISPIGSIPTLKTVSSPEAILNGIHCLFGLKRVKVPTRHIKINVHTEEGISSKIVPLEDRIVSGSLISDRVGLFDYVDESAGQFVKGAL